MISMPPNERVLHAYVDHHLSDPDRRLVDTWLAAHAEDAARVQGWQQDAQQLRAVLGGALQQQVNPDLDPTSIRQRLKRQSHRRLTSAAILLITISAGGLGGWEARELSMAGAAPMTDALQAYRLFAQQGILPADFKVQDNTDMQAWLDRYFTQANRLPDFQATGFKAVSGRLLSTDQGPAAMVLYEAPDGRRISFYIRPPGPAHNLLPNGSRSDGELQVEYWSGAGYNYALVSPADQARLPLFNRS
jgi:anti-sigma factor RsiW